MGHSVAFTHCFHGQADLGDGREHLRSELLDELPDSVVVLGLLPKLSSEEKKNLRSCNQHLRHLVNSTVTSAHIRACTLTPTTTLGTRFPALTHLSASDSDHLPLTDATLLAFLSGEGCDQVLFQLQELDLKRCHYVTGGMLEQLLGAAPSLVKLRPSRWADPGTLHTVSQFTHIQELDLGDADVDVITVDDVSLAALSKMTNLVSLGLSRCKWLSDAAFTPLAALTGLEALNLAGTEVGAAALEVLGGMPGLMHLNLSGCRRIDDSCLSLLSRFPRLTSLQVADTSISNSGLSALRSVPHLAVLDLGWRFEVSDEGLEHLAVAPGLRHLRAGSFNLVMGVEGPRGRRGLPHLQHLSFGGSFANKGLHLLFPMPRLTSLHVQGIDSVTDSMMKVLSTQTTLQRLSLRSGYTLTQAGLAALHSLPHLKELSVSACPAIDTRGLRDAFVAAQVSLGQLLVSCCRAMRVQELRAMGLSV